MGSGDSPVLLYVAGVVPANAVAMSLGIVGVTSAAAACLYYREGNIHLKAIVLLGITGMGGAYAGTGLSYSEGEHMV